MKYSRIVKLSAGIFVFLCLIGSCEQTETSADGFQSKIKDESRLVTRFAKLQIDSTRLEEYMGFLVEGIKTSVATEPGVLTMYAVQEQDRPYIVTVLEIYASDSAYQSHLNTDHFLRYKTGTLEMVQALELIDLNPIVLERKNIKLIE